jgi:hypothetical protein
VEHPPRQKCIDYFLGNILTTKEKKMTRIEKEITDFSMVLELVQQTFKDDTVEGQIEIAKAVHQALVIKACFGDMESEMADIAAQFLGK